MTSFDESDQTSIADFIVQNLPKHKLFTLGTVDELGLPWVVCLNLVYDENINIIWKSQKNTDHSKHITNNENVSICIFSQTQDSGDFGLYTKATAKEVNDKKELQKLLDIKYTSKGKALPPMEDFLAEAEYRIYVAKIQEAWVNDTRHIKARVDLAVLRKRAIN